MSSKKDNISNAVVILIAMVTGVVIGLMFASHASQEQRDTPLQEKIGEVVNLMEREYVDSIDTDSLSERLLGVMLQELDPHSVYQTARQTEKTEELIRGNFEGVGLVLHREGDSTFVGQVLADGPSSESGLLPGDMFVSINGERVIGMPTDSIIARLRGPRRSTVEVTVSRLTSPSTSKNLSFKLRRGIVNHTTLQYHAMLDDTTGYIMLSSFSSTSYSEFHNALIELKNKGMHHLIFDLRGNSGGALSSAVGIANELLPAGSLIVYTQGVHQRRNDIVARPGGQFTKGRVTVMVDEGSASASEVVSGALQDNDRALIVGRRTFGKGLVQNEFELSDGSSVLLTTARYYTPSGRSIQRPYNRGTDEYYRDYLDQLVEESYADNPTLHITDSTPYHTVGGRVVYGGGGIFPDQLIPYRKDSSYVYFNRLSGQGIISHTAFEEVRLHAGEMLRRYPNADAFCRHYEVSDALLHRLVTNGEQAGIPVNPKGLTAQRKLIKTMLKANIGNTLYGGEAFYRIYLEEDDDLKRIKKTNK